MSLSFRKLFGGETPADAARLRAQGLIDEGIAAENAGKAAHALVCFQRAAEADPAFAPAHMNLGIALCAASRLDEGIARYRRAIELDPHYAPAHHNLGLAYLALSRWSDAESSFREALVARPQMTEAIIGLAAALQASSRYDESLAELSRAIALQPDHVGALQNRGVLLRKLGRFEEGVENERRLTGLAPSDFESQYRLAANLHDLGRHREAEGPYRKALAQRPDDLEATINLGLVLFELNRARDAIPLFFKAAAAVPHDPRCRAMLAQALRDIELTRVDDSQRSVLVALCRDNDIPTIFLTTTILGYLKSHPGFAKLRTAASCGRDPFDDNDPIVATLLRDPLVLAALPRMRMADAEIESILTHLRRAIALRTTMAQDSPAPLDFTCALARQSFYSGFVLRQSDEEARHVGQLRTSIETALADPAARVRALEYPIAVASAYGPVHALRGADRLLDDAQWNPSPAFAALVKEQLRDRRLEQAIAAGLSTITGIEDETSLAVRAQYEDNPYPRWVTVPKPPPETFESLSQRLRGTASIPLVRPLPILVAGCGSGHHAIQVARQFPEGEVLAVDLSRASLAYATRMSQEFGVANITYRQGDILELGTLARRFAIVECGGVLHHLRDPMAGWRVLRGLVEPYGLMKIALYSHRTRASVRAAREFVASLRLPNTPEGMRACRYAIAALPEAHPARGVMTFADFYTLDEFRDLVLHVQEHQFTLPQIGRCLDELGLRLLMLEVNPATRERFEHMYPASDAKNDLEAWDRFEEAYPDTFRAMYSLWCSPA